MKRTKNLGEKIKGCDRYGKNSIKLFSGIFAGDFEKKSFFGKKYFGSYLFYALFSGGEKLVGKVWFSILNSLTDEIKELILKWN